MVTRQHSPLLGTDEFDRAPTGSDVEALGPSDNSDSGSDVVGAYSQEQLDSTGDAMGTGERGTLDDGSADGADIAPDKIVQPDGDARPLSDDEVDALVDELAQDDPQADRASEPDGAPDGDA